MKYIKPKNVKSAYYFDIANPNAMENWHANIQAAKSAIASIKYCTKYDTSPLELGSMDYKQETAAKQSKQKILGKRIVSGEPIVDIINDGNEDLVMQYQKLITNQRAYLVDSVKAPPPLEECCGVWVYGPPGVGKSHYVRHQCGYTEDQILNKGINKWLNDWVPGKHKVVLLDDFSHKNKELH